MMAVDELMDRIPPQANEAEQAVLGAMLLERDAIVRAAELLKADDFYREAHRILFTAIMELYGRHEPADLWLLANELEKTDKLEVAGGRLYLRELIDNAYLCAAGIGHYAAIVIEKAQLRQLIRAGSRLIEMGYDSRHEIREIIAECERTVLAVNERGKSESFAGARAGVLMAAEFDRMDKETETGVISRGLFSNLPALNDISMPGLHPGDICYLAGCTSTGKTTLAMSNFAWPCARAGGKVLVLSCEMSQRKIALRSIASQGGIESWRLQDGAFRTKHWRAEDEHGSALAGPVADTIREVWEKHLYVLYTSGLTASAARAKAIRLKQEIGGLDLLVIDGLWLMQSDSRQSSRRAELEDASRRLKGLAGELACPLLVIHQLSRAGVQRQDKRPLLTDLRETGAIEQDADMVLMTHRPSGLEGGEPIPDTFLLGQLPEIRHRAWSHYSELLMRKNRDGEPNITCAFFDGARNRFTPWENEYGEPFGQ